MGVGKEHSFAGARYRDYSSHFRSERSEGPSHFVDLKEGSTCSTWLMADGAGAHIPLVTSRDCECRTFSSSIILGRRSERYDMAKLDEKGQRKEKQRTSDLRNIVATVFHSDTASIE